MHVVEAFVPNGEPSIPMEPSDGAFDDPARAAEMAAVRGMTTRDQRLDAAREQGLAQAPGVIGAIALHDRDATAGTPGAAAQRRNGIHQGQQGRTVDTVGSGQDRDERDAVRFGEDVMFRTRLAAIGWVRSSFFPPRNARSEPLSTTARARSSWPRRRSSASKTW